MHTLCIYTLTSNGICITLSSRLITHSSRDTCFCSFKPTDQVFHLCRCCYCFFPCRCHFISLLPAAAAADFSLVFVSFYLLLISLFWWIYIPTFYSNISNVLLKLKSHWILWGIFFIFLKFPYCSFSHLICMIN